MESTALPLLPHGGWPSRFTVAATLRRQDAARVRVSWQVGGELPALRVSGTARQGFHDDLWRHTCFEAFFSAGGSAYLEYNLSAEGAWAAYQFDDYRCGRASLTALPPPVATTSQDAHALKITADLILPAPFLAAPLRAGLTAVLEDQAGAISYWALAHPAPTADFHHPGGFVLAVPALP
jgi:hypothetical protein